MDANTRSASSGITALIMAASNGHTDTVTALIAGGADVNARSSSDWTALKFARANGHTEIVRILQQAGAKE
jgi:ankyrin repeat protein